MASRPFMFHCFRMELLFCIRIIFGTLFVAILAGGYFLFKNMDRLVAHPNENAVSSGLNKVQIITIWLHALALTGGFAFLIH